LEQPATEMPKGTADNIRTTNVSKRRMKPPRSGCG
jgi:hypothetical protein